MLYNIFLERRYFYMHNKEYVLDDKDIKDLDLNKEKDDFER